MASTRERIISIRETRNSQGWSPENPTADGPAQGGPCRGCRGRRGLRRERHPTPFLQLRMPKTQESLRLPSFPHTPRPSHQQTVSALSSKQIQTLTTSQHLHRYATTVVQASTFTPGYSRNFLTGLPTPTVPFYNPYMTRVELCYRLNCISSKSLY